MELSELSAAIAQAIAEWRLPPAEGASKPLTFADDHLGESGWKLMWEVIRQVRECYPATFVRFTERRLADQIFQIMAEHPDLALVDLTEQLSTYATGHGRRVVSTPICNLCMNSSAIRLADDAVLVRGDRDRHADTSDEDIVADSNIERWLGVRMSRPLQVIGLPTYPETPFDTRRTAALLTIEEGVPPLPATRARARAQYAVALWVVLAPPPGRQVLPDVGVWAPQATALIPQRHRRIPAPGESASGILEEDNGFHQYSPFELPEDEDLRIPFEAMTHVDRRGAQALLSAGLHLLNASRASRLLPCERARALMAAVESLGDRNQAKHARDRFMRLARHHGTDQAAEARGWSSARVEEAMSRIAKARNIASHGVDGVLLDLGYPADVERKMLYGPAALGTELAAGSIQSDLPTLVHVVGRTLALTIRELAHDEWSDAAFADYFT